MPDIDRLLEMTFSPHYTGGRIWTTVGMLERSAVICQAAVSEPYIPIRPTLSFLATSLNCALTKRMECNMHYLRLRTTEVLMIARSSGGGQMHRVVTCLMVVGFFLSVLVVTVRAGDSGKGPSKTGNEPAAKSDDSTKPEVREEVRKDGKAAVESEMQELRDLVQSQTEELHELRNRLAAVEAGVTASREAAAPVAASPAGPVQPSTSAAITAASISPNAMKQDAARDQNENKSPLSFKIGSADFTPGGFLDFTSIYRSTNLGSGVATSFGSIPFNNQLPQAGLSETRFSAQYSRLSLKVDTHLTDSTSLTGYVETDFLGYQPPNAYVTANSDSLRLRLYWADVRHDKWEVLAGQAWSLLTPNRVGLSPLTPDVFVTLDEDPNFQVGLTWARQPQVRVVYHPTSNWAIGLSFENPQQFVPGSVVFPLNFVGTQFDNGSSNTSLPSSATNTAIPNLHPDIILKAAFDAHPGGRSLHVEAAGLLRSFKAFNNLTTPASTNTITGGGASLNVNYEVIHNLHLVANSFYSDGGGRYIFGLGPDVIVKPNGTLSGVHSGSGVGGFEYQATPHYMFYGYYGGAYFARNFGFLAATPTSSCDGVPGFTCVGFGFPGSANTANRLIQEGTIGVIPTLWSNANYGRLQVITQYSYLVRTPWSIFSAPGNPKNAHLSMVYVGLRYILP